MTKLGAIVTGSSSGIGEAIAVKLAKLDYRLVVTGRSPEDVCRVSQLCLEASPSSLKPAQVVADLNEEADVDRLFQESMAHLGDQLNLLVNNAGYGEPVPVEETDRCYEAYKRIMQINMNATVRLTLLAAPVLEKSAKLVGRSSSVINIGSIAATRPMSSLFAYGASKAAMKSFTEYMAWQLAPLVRVNTISPGPIATKIAERSGFAADLFEQLARQTSLRRRIGAPEEVADCVSFLADSQRADFITGANLVVDGGCQLAPVEFKV